MKNEKNVGGRGVIKLSAKASVVKVNSPSVHSLRKRLIEQGVIIPAK